MMPSTIQEEAENDPVIETNVPGSAAKSSPRPVKIPKLEGEAKTQSGLLAVDVDSTYQQPVDRPIKPGKRASCHDIYRADKSTVACFYVRQKDATKDYYRAVYLLQRTVRDLVNGISRKFDIDPHRVTQVTHINSKGLHIVVDEDVVREVPEGQDMLVEFYGDTFGITGHDQLEDKQSKFLEWIGAVRP